MVEGAPATVHLEEDPGSIIIRRAQCELDLVARHQQERQVSAPWRAPLIARLLKYPRGSFVGRVVAGVRDPGITLTGLGPESAGAKGYVRVLLYLLQGRMQDACNGLRRPPG
jgi:hypothetical protein